MVLIDKVTHSANLLVCVAGVATATGLVAGAGAGIGGLLSLREISRRLPPEVQPLADEIASRLQEELTANHLPDAHRTLIPQMIEMSVPDADEVMAAGKRVEPLIDTMIGKLKDPAHQPALLQDNFRAVLRGPLTTLLVDPAYATQLSAAFQTIVLQGLAEANRKLDLLLERSKATARKLGVNEGLVIGLARRYAGGDHGDFDSAYRGLERALEVAAERPQASNISAEVDAIVAEVDRLTREDSPDAGMAALKAALEADLAEEERRAAARLRLLDTGIRQAILTRSVDDAAEFVVEKTAREVPDPAQRFNALRAVQDEWYARGRDKGLNFDLEVSITLARASCNRATNPDQRGAALDDLGTALATLGERESGTERLEKAVTAYRAALEEWTRDRVPVDWAMTQNNLGNALLALGARDSGTARLKEAVIAYRAALQERTRDRVPLDWATTQNNLGNALQTLGARESDTKRLAEAVTAYRAALEEYTRDRVPMDWAMTQNNLGSALAALGERDSGTARLEEAVTAYRAALEEYTRDRVPLKWAGTQNNLGTALSTLGERESGTARLEEAVTAYRAALEEYTRDRVPLQWAMTTANLGQAHESLFDRTGDRAQLDRALAHVRAAREVFDAAGASHYIETSDRILARMTAKL